MQRPRTLPYWISALLLVVCTGGCAFFDETHFFKQAIPQEDTPNYFRLRVTGSAQFSSARYISGYYDERAVDLFFNEINISGAGTQERNLFKADLKSPGSTEPILPLDPKLEHGRLVMLLSTNASGVANAIGAFAESQITSDAITNLVNRSAIESGQRVAADLRQSRARSAAVIGDLDELVGKFPNNADPKPDETNQAVLRFLNALGRALGAEPFSDITQAKAWFQARRSTKEVR